MAKKTANIFIASLKLPSAPGQVLHRALYRALLDNILPGRLAPGSRLPSTRALARQLGISRNSVEHAYDLLKAEGYLESRVGSGTYVSRRLPDSASTKRIQFSRQAASSKLTDLLAKSSYPLVSVDLEDCEGNSIYLYSSGQPHK